MKAAGELHRGMSCLNPTALRLQHLSPRGRGQYTRGLALLYIVAVGSCPTSGHRAAAPLKHTAFFIISSPLPAQEQQDTVKIASFPYRRRPSCVPRLPRNTLVVWWCPVPCVSKLPRRTLVLLSGGIQNSYRGNDSMTCGGIFLAFSDTETNKISGSTTST